MAVVGSSQATPAQRETARAVGEAIARRRAVLVCGGRGGVMEAACEGARAGRGVTVGILPGWDRGEANPFVDVAIPTGMGELRNGLVVRAADALVAVGGEWGTLSEIALAVRAGTPVVGLDTWELGRPGIHVASDPEQAVELALRLAHAGRPSTGA